MFVGTEVTWENETLHQKIEDEEMEKDLIEDIKAFKKTVIGDLIPKAAEEPVAKGDIDSESKADAE